MSFGRDLVAIDRERVDLRAGVLGLVVLAVLGATIAVFGPVALAAVIGALVALATDPPPAGRSWATALLPLVVGGTLVTFLAVWIGDRAVPAALLVGGVGVVVTLHAGTSRKAGVRSLVATLWIIVALTLGDTDHGAVDYALAFALGATAGSVVARLRARDGAAEGTGDDHVEAGTPEAPPTLGAAIRGPLGQFALLRGAGLAIAVLLGFTWFPEHPAWMAITALIVYSQRILGADAAESGRDRLAETVLGAAIAFAVLGLIEALSRRRSTD